MLQSSIVFKNGIPCLQIDGALHAPLAYTTYFEERGEYSDFAKSGYKMFFVNVSFTDLPINNVTGFTPFRTGVFETDTPDYSEFDSTVKRILKDCPDAFIFPRINIAMPRKWIAENEKETVATPTGRRESLYSDRFRRDGETLLKTLVNHIRNADYADRIAGYQLCGGSTQEWIHHDLAGSFCEQSLAQFRSWMQNTYGVADVPTLTRDDFNKPEYMEAVSRFGEFSCQKNAETVEYFCKALKEHIHHAQIVGVFYGYNAFVHDYLWGLQGLRFIIDSRYIDFFSSPCAYEQNRNFGVDWGDMLPSASLKLHDKLYFAECDIRTHLTRRMQDNRPGLYSDEFYGTHDQNGNKTVWCGPDTAELSLSALRKTFARQVVNGSGIWWFDMWGGWYHDFDIMAELTKMKQLAESVRENDNDRFPSAETVLFIDEKAYLNNPRHTDYVHRVNQTRGSMGNTGIPFDICMTEDAARVLHKYKAAIFTAPLPSDSGKNAAALCEEMHIPALHPTEEHPSFTKTELRDYLVSHGVHCYNEQDSVIYCGNGFVGIHVTKDGETQIKLPAKYKVRPLFGADFEEHETDCIKIFLEKHQTAVFELL
ncbi:MAG: hypothetical protein E7523_09540 [Ruminococcaceae bacterium]|nr:hypothetical protein [Oscillospiraceae bacterium]